MITLGYEAQLIVNFLKTAPEAFFSEREIARKAGQKGQFRANPDWAKPFLFRLANENFIQTDAFGHYRIAPEREQAKQRSIPLAPSVAKTLASSDKIFDLMEIFADTPKDSIAELY
jgi:hypothetical protein